VGMIGISIKKFEILLYTASGDYGFKCEFGKGLSVIRGNNSSGKSTLINALIYSLGMEELVGGKGVKVLPYALKEYVEGIEKDKIKISSSYVMIEIENKLGEVITLKRAIVSENKDSKLVEIIQGAYLSKGDSSYKVIPTYLSLPYTFYIRYC
jgi:AAA15 family ATPase/GTPase